MNQTHLRPATLKQFNWVLNSWALPAGRINPPKFFLFIALDHGCNNAFNPNDWPKAGDQTPPIYDGGNWGSYDDEDEIYPPRD